MSEFRFADPQFAHVLWAVLAFVGLLFWLDLRGGSAIEGLVGTSLQQRLVKRPGAWRRRLRIVLLGLAATAAVLALMRPQWGMRVVAASRVGAEIMIALDVSRSMLAEDVAPNRLGRAKAEIVDLLSYLDGDQVGLIAFAGRASVLSPLTPDFGFLRLVLEETGPGSVTRGGTKLAEPIRKAVAGFGPSEGASRAILLITDGEDHDSFAPDAAKEAAAAGVKIIAIGFGDEAGSEIRISDPRTGVSSLVRDADGRPVRTHLDGDLLRELALVTDGAYVPAGTGVLDLESIYDEHIARLTRGELDGSRRVRDEGYPWFVLLALVLLVSSAVVSAGRLRGTALAGVLLALSLVAPPPASAQTPAAGEAFDLALDPDSLGPDPLAGQDEAGPQGSQGPEESEAASADPRAVYNRAIAAIAALEYDEAESLLERARRDARGDDELRFHASYNQGWVSVQQSGRVQAEAPAQALALLHRAADWFREAVRLRPDDDEARHNLEVTLKRALVLADEIARGQDGGIAGALAELAGRQRAVAAGVAGLLEASRREQAPLDPSEALRGAFRAQATSQRAVLSDADQLSLTLVRERDAIEARPEEERTPEDGMRAAQLSNVEVHLHRARERMGQARRQLRQRQGQRAYRRAAAALASLKRAADQLRDPVAVLDQLLGDGTELARQTLILALSQQQVPGRVLPPLPSWLDVEGTAEGQASFAERISELSARFEAGLAQADAADPASIPSEQVELLAQVREAQPFIHEADDHARAAAVSLDAGEVDAAPESQGQTLRALAEARERFLDVRGLIEAIYDDERQIAEVAATEGEDAAQHRNEYVPALRAAQAGSLGRAERLAGKLAAQADELAALAAALEAGVVDPDSPAPDPETVADQREHLEIAGKVLALAHKDMAAVGKGLGDPDVAPETVDWEWIRSDSASAVEHIETLRRLFFSIAEHLREVAQRQLDLADSTQDALASSAAPDADPQALAGPLVDPQRSLAEQALAIANGLERQSSEAAEAAAADPQAAEASERLRSAGEHVLGAHGEMENAIETLQAPADLAATRESQEVALEELRAALEILEPPKPDPQQDGSEQQQQQQQQQEQQGAQDPEEGEDAKGKAGTPEEQAAAEKPGEPEQVADPAQLLQEVRDREAQRRRDRARRAAGYETVEKDW